MFFRILIGVGLAAAGYFVGREVGRRETVSQPSTGGESAGPEPPRSDDQTGARQSDRRDTN